MKSCAALSKRQASIHQEFFDKINRSEYKDRIRVNTDEVIARGGFGTPTIFVNGSMFFGNDRIVLVEEELRKSSRRISCKGEERGKGRGDSVLLIPRPQPLTPNSQLAVPTPLLFVLGDLICCRMLNFLMLGDFELVNIIFHRVIQRSVFLKNAWY